MEDLKSLTWRKRWPLLLYNMAGGDESNKLLSCGPLGDSEVSRVRRAVVPSTTSVYYMATIAVSTTIGGLDPHSLVVSWYTTFTYTPCKTAVELLACSGRCPRPFPWLVVRQRTLSGKPARRWLVAVFRFLGDVHASQGQPENGRKTEVSGVAGSRNSPQVALQDIGKRRDACTCSKPCDGRKPARPTLTDLRNSGPADMPRSLGRPIRHSHHGDLFSKGRALSTWCR